MEHIVYLQIENDIRSARATAVEHAHHRLYHVVFEDGYENMFFTDVENGEWIEEDLGFTALAYEVGKQIKSFMRNPIHVPKLLTWHKQYIKDKLVCFGFFNFMNGNQKFYQIYNANKKYMYTLVDMDNDEWQILGNSSILGSNIDSTFVRQVIDILPLYTANAR